MMKMIARFAPLASMAITLSITVGCPGGTVDGVDPEDGGPAGGDCLVDTDCEGDGFCHPYLLTCVDNCATTADACSGDTSICNEEDANGDRPLDNAAFNNMCVCDDTTCAAGQVCSGDYGVCIDSCDAAVNDCEDFDGDAQACFAIGDDNFCQPACAADTDCGVDAPICDIVSGQCLQGCQAVDGLRVECGVDELCDVLTGECFAGCTLVGEQDTCAAGELCVADGTCEAECDDDLCLNTDEVCHTDATAVATFNQCVDADVENDIDPVTCPSVTHLDARDADGPVLYGLETVVTVAEGDEVDSICNAGQDLVEFAALYFDGDSDVSIDEDPAAYGVAFQVGCDDCTAPGIGGVVGLYFPQGGARVTYDGDATSGEFIMFNCYDTAPSNLAVQMIDLGGNFSNSVCYEE